MKLPPGGGSRHPQAAGITLVAMMPIMKTCFRGWSPISSCRWLVRRLPVRLCACCYENQERKRAGKDAGGTKDELMAEVRSLSAPRWMGGAGAGVTRARL